MNPGKKVDNDAVGQILVYVNRELLRVANGQYVQRGNSMISSGSLSSPIWLIGEAPGPDEITKGEQRE